MAKYGFYKLINSSWKEIEIISAKNRKAAIDKLREREEKGQNGCWKLRKISD